MSGGGARKAGGSPSKRKPPACSRGRTQPRRMEEKQRRIRIAGRRWPANPRVPTVLVVVGSGGDSPRGQARREEQMWGLKRRPEKVVAEGERKLGGSNNGINLSVRATAAANSLGKAIEMERLGRSRRFYRRRGGGEGAANPLALR
jgi:hypothetical protein